MYDPDDEHYECLDCGEITSNYNRLWHPNETEGGFCPCCHGDVTEIKDEDKC